MTVRIEKPAINVREELADLRKPSGVAGEAMLRAETPQEQFNLIGAGRRNLIINGAMNVSQRGDYSSASGVGTGNYYLDRWRGSLTSIGATVQNTGRKLKLAANGSGTGAIRMGQIFEDNDMVPHVGKYMTVSAKVKSNNPNARILIYAGTGWEAWSDPVPADEQEHYVKLTFVLSSSTNVSVNLGLDGENSADVSIQSGDYIEFTEVQLELGKVATPFEHRSYGEELAACQRYYERWTLNGGYIGTAGYNETTSNSRGLFPFTVTKRTAPTMATSGAHFTATSTGTTGSSVNISWDSASIYSVRWLVTNSNSTLVDGGAAILGVSGNGRWIEADAEL